MSQLLCTLFPARFIPPIGTPRSVKNADAEPIEELHSEIKGKILRDFIHKMLKYETTTANIAGWVGVTNRNALHHLAILEKENRVRRTASRSSRANRWVAI